MLKLKKNVTCFLGFIAVVTCCLWTFTLADAAPVLSAYSPTAVSNWKPGEEKAFEATIIDGSMFNADAPAKKDVSFQVQGEQVVGTVTDVLAGTRAGGTATDQLRFLVKGVLTYYGAAKAEGKSAAEPTSGVKVKVVCSYPGANGARQTAELEFTIFIEHQPETPTATGQAAMDPTLTLRKVTTNKPKYGAGDTGLVTVEVGNESEMGPVQNLLVRAEEPTGQLVVDVNSAAYVPVLPPSGCTTLTYPFSVSAVTAKEQRDAVGVALFASYEFINAKGEQQKGEAKFTIPISLLLPHPTRPPLVVTVGDYPAEVRAGESFPLPLTLKNTSEKYAADSIFFEVKTEDARLFSRDPQGKTIHLQPLPPGGEYAFDIPIVAAGGKLSGPTAAAVNLVLHSTSANQEYSQDFTWPLTLTQDTKPAVARLSARVDRKEIPPGESLSIAFSAGNQTIVQEGERGPQMFNVRVDVRPHAGCGTKEDPKPVNLPNIVPGAEPREKEITITPTIEEPVSQKQVVLAGDQVPDAPEAGEPNDPGAVLAPPVFAPTPLPAGPKDWRADVVLTYYDENENEHVVTREVSVTIMPPEQEDFGGGDAMMDGGMPMPEPEEPKKGKTKIVIIVGSAAIVVIVTAVVVVVKKRKAKRSLDEDEDI
ncbi:MAG: hypothetical protein LBJ38_00820 [Oscillospiraceae bacterium]|jgi:hypothetical protein|nr:hypothetical protein [Oscillospiraceae bacterium]